jgi:DNA polymerase-3 subunit beta
VLLEAKESALSLVSTNLEIGVRASVRGKVEREGSFTVNAKLLSEYVSLLPNGRVDIELTDAKEGASAALAIKAGEHETTILGNSPEEFPLLPNIERTITVAVLAKDLRGALSQVLFSCAKDEGRPELQGIFVHIEQLIFTLAATDSFRLAEKKISLNLVFVHPSQFSAIIPSRRLTGLARILGVFEAQSPIELSFATNQVMAAAEGVEFLSRLVDRKYPDYAQVIPKAALTTARLPKTELLTAVRSASLFCRSGVNDVRLTLSNTGVTVAASGAKGTQSARVPGEINGPDAALVLNARYLLEGLAAIDSLNVRLEVSSTSSPCVLRAADVGEPLPNPYLYLIMPIKQ